jgi:hypothetical protein
MLSSTSLGLVDVVSSASFDFLTTKEGPDDLGRLCVLKQSPSKSRGVNQEHGCRLYFQKLALTGISQSSKPVDIINIDIPQCVSIDDGSDTTSTSALPQQNVEENNDE